MQIIYKQETVLLICKLILPMLFLIDKTTKMKDLQLNIVVIK